MNSMQKAETANTVVAQHILHKQAWDYFAIVAAQRLTTLNFYVIISSVIASAQFTVLVSNQRSRVAALLGVLLVFLSYVFWKWDRRSSDMVKVAEDALKYFENLVGWDDEGDVPHVVKVLRREEYLTNQLRKKRSLLFWRNYYTYRTCLNLIYGGFALVGFVGLVYALFF